uniref:RNA-directed DNA polymerase, eukaryota n=1 Tax=Tanacetum cinerariifolium TaxID=118510 RepID=A0A6L2LPD5_TANCI|nr:RNA-directed DNA polymerase, eukaryota [Tanacetum cinerariifolium]
MGATANMNSFRSFKDHIKRISNSVYVTNFPDSVNPRDLWNSCSAYGRHHLFANKVRYERPQKSVSSFNTKPGANSKPPSTLVLHQPAVRTEGFGEIKLSYFGGMWVMIELNNVETKNDFLHHTGVKSWFHKLQDGTLDFVSDERIVWVDIEGIPLSVWSHATFSKIGKKWGELMDIEESVGSSFARKRICIKTNAAASILETFKVIFKGKTFMEATQLSEDPFGFYKILKKPHVNDVRESNSSLTHPPGYTPEPSHQETHKEPLVQEMGKCFDSPIQKGSSPLAPKSVKEPSVIGLSSESSTSFHSRKTHNGGSILDVLDNVIKSIFKKDGATVFDNFIALYGTWLPSNTKILFVVIYAPQTTVLKRLLLLANEFISKPMWLIVFWKLLKSSLKVKPFMVRAKELFTWTPCFLEYNKPECASDDELPHYKSAHSDQDNELSVKDSDDEGVSDTYFGDNSSNDQEATQLSKDPFGFYKILKKPPVNNVRESDFSLIHPSGYTPEPSHQETHKEPLVQEMGTCFDSPIQKGSSPLAPKSVKEPSVIGLSSESSTSFHSRKTHNGGSILNVLDNVIKIFSLNVQGLSQKTKKDWVKELSTKNRVNFLALQETKMERISHMDVKFIWGNLNFQFVSSDSVGNSGGTWLPSNTKILFVVIYAPQTTVLKRMLWEYISALANRWNGETIVLGDFNEVRTEEERFGSIFNPSSARTFNQFIASSGLIEVKMEGYSFTWTHPSASKMSKLDCFIVSDGIFSTFPSITTVCLDRRLSDHRPIFLNEIHADFGPIPVRFYHSWLEREGFDSVVRQAWHSFNHNDPNRIIRFKKKLQGLKQIIRVWIRDVAQKAKVQWAIEGDENSKFFHGIINKRCAQLGIRGIFVNGLWTSDPSSVKRAFVDHFAKRFNQPMNARLKLNMMFHNQLIPDQVEDLDRNITNEEIKAAVWACVANKSPGPDGYTFEFFRRYWDIIGSDFCTAVDWFFVSGSFPRGCNASFITLIPKVTDAKFVTDFRPISLIGCVYKVITKILANRLSLVISDLVSNTQSAFIKNRQVRDGAESQQWADLLSLLGTFSLSPSIDRWVCDLNGDGSFRVKDFRSVLDDFILPSSNMATRWVKCVLVKVHVLRGVPGLSVFQLETI